MERLFCDGSCGRHATTFDDISTRPPLSPLKESSRNPRIHPEESPKTKDRDTPGMASADAGPTPTAASSASGVLATCAAHGLTAAEFGRLRERSVAAKGAAYCPYSGFRVGAAVLWASTGTGPGASDEGGAAVTTGANVENASYPVGTCAERVAVARAVVEGGRAFRAVAVATDVSPPASPCGMCRQLCVFSVSPSLPLSLSTDSLQHPRVLQTRSPHHHVRQEPRLPRPHPGAGQSPVETLGLLSLTGPHSCCQCPLAPRTCPIRLVARGRRCSACCRLTRPGRRRHGI